MYMVCVVLEQIIYSGAAQKFTLLWFFLEDEVGMYLVCTYALAGRLVMRVFAKYRHDILVSPRSYRCDPDKISFSI